MEPSHLTPGGLGGQDTMPGKVILLLLLMLAVSADLPSQGRCYKCKQEGWIACSSKEHDRRRHCGISLEHRCDAVLGAECCNGLERVLCPSCRNPVVEAGLEEERSSRLAWLERARALDREAGIPMAHVETANFLLHFSIPTWKIPARTLTRSRAAHLFAERLENVAARFQAVTGVLPATKQVLYLVNDANENLKVTLLRMGGGHQTTFKTYSTTSQVCQWPDPARGLGGDEGFHAHTAHNGAHTLIQSSIAFQRQLAPWLDNGLAHWIEIDEFKVSRTFCFNEVMPKSSWETGDWYKKVFGEVSSGKEDSFAALISRDRDRMDHRDHAFCWSFVDFLIRVHPQDFVRLFAEIKRTNDTKKALEEVMGLSTTAFHQEWRAWVLKTYGGR